LEKCKAEEIKQDQLLKKVIRIHDNFLTVGDINIPMNVYVKNAKDRIKKRMSIATSRTELISKYGFDTKFGLNLIRLLIEGRDFLKNGEIYFPLKEKDFLLDIKYGKYTAQDIFKFRDDLLEEINEYEKTTKLPKAPNLEAIRNFVNSEMKKII